MILSSIALHCIILYYIDREHRRRGKLCPPLGMWQDDDHSTCVSHQQETFAGFQKSVRVLPTADVEVELGTADEGTEDST